MFPGWWLILISIPIQQYNLDSEVIGHEAKLLQNQRIKSKQKPNGTINFSFSVPSSNTNMHQMYQSKRNIQSSLLQILLTVLLKSSTQNTELIAS